LAERMTASGQTPTFTALKCDFHDTIKSGHRPRDRPCPEVTVHSMTSSARASDPGGKSKPEDALGRTGVVVLWTEMVLASSSSYD